MSSVRSFLTLVRSHRGLLWGAVVAGTVHHVTAIAVAAIGAFMVGSVATGGASVESLRPWFWGLVVLLVPLAVSPWLESLLSHMAAFRILAEIRTRLHLAFERLAPAYFLRSRSGDAGARIIGDVELLELFFAHTLAALVVAVIVPVAALVVVLSLHWSLALVLVALMGAVATVPVWLGKLAQEQGAAIRLLNSDVTAGVIDSIQGLREIISFRYGYKRAEEMRRSASELVDAQVDHARRVGTEKMAVDAIVASGTVSILVVAGLLVVSGWLDAALFPVAVVVAAMSFTPVTAVLDVANELNLVGASATRVLEVLEERPAVEDRVSETPTAPLEPRIEVEAASFRYRENLPLAVADSTFSVEPGETVALVGHSGAGKSTTAHLVARFWEPESGSVRIGGVDLRDMPQDYLREILTFVPQDVYLFNTTIRENIRLAHRSATDEEVESASQRAMLAEVVDALPDGYDTVVGERGAQLSGGQRQRVAFARALLRDTPIVVMDEPTSSLDAASEQALVQAMRATMEGRTVLVIAHRLSTITAADRLVVMQEGRVVETGSHSDLLRQDGTYARLVAPQLVGSA